MSQRERLASKRRRTLDVPVLVSDPSQDQQTLMEVTAALGVARGREPDATTAELERTQQDLAEKVQEHWVMVRLQSLSSDDWEVVTAECQGEDGIDWTRALPVLLSASCTDPELQDEDWWREILAKPEWSDGDKNALRIGLWQLNVIAADPTVPKG